ncbi:MAG: signal peptide peptidase SppA [Clostridiales bacterium]|nr:signal peptide peptidase SppA [Clostridiales bacterium]
MRKGNYVLIIVLIFIFLITATIFAFLYYEFRRPPAVKANSYLEIDLTGPVHEFAEPEFWTNYFLGIRPLSIHDLWQNIRKAKAHSRVRCLLLRIGYLECDWAKASEIREAVLDFKKSGKKAYAYVEEAPEFDKEYYLATACDRIVLHPLGWLGVNGIGGWVPFVKKGLGKLGVEVEVEHVEEYKTAYNMFTEEEFTPAHRTMMESLYGDIFGQYVRAVAEARKKTEEEVRQLIDQGLFQGEKALQAGLVDDLLYQDELEKLLLEKEKKLERIKLSEYDKVSLSSVGLGKGRKVALIYAMGPIHSGEGYYQTIGGRTLSRWIRRAREDRSVAAIVLRVDSPGGSAVASDVIWREVALAKKEKPVVVSMSDLAGSGGYWISMAANKIVAQPQTLTGSIGVLSGKVNMSAFYEKMGITAEKLTYGKRADLFTTFRGLTPEEKEFLKKEILWIYDRFLSKAAEGRNLSKEDVDKVSRGRVWTGSQAKEIGLVDEVGGITKAIELAKKLAGIPLDEDVRLIIWPKKISFFASLFGRKEAKISHPLLSPDMEKLLLIFRVLEKEKPWAIMPLWHPTD